MRPIITLLTKVAGDLPFALGAILLVIAGILVYVVVVIRAAKKRQKMATAAMQAVSKLKPAGSGKEAEQDAEKKPSILDRIRRV